jgi:hypothetical protein
MRGQVAIHPFGAKLLIRPNERPNLSVACRQGPLTVDVGPDAFLFFSAIFVAMSAGGASSVSSAATSRRSACSTAPAPYLRTRTLTSVRQNRSGFAHVVHARQLRFGALAGAGRRIPFLRSTADAEANYDPARREFAPSRWRTKGGPSCVPLIDAASPLRFCADLSRS